VGGFVPERSHRLEVGLMLAVLLVAYFGQRSIA
jgi:hypothetical protein